MYLLYGRIVASVLPYWSPGFTALHRMTLRVFVFIDFVYWLTLTFTKAPGPSGDRGGWPWRALRWCAPRWPGCTSSRQVPVQFAVPGAAGHNRWRVAETPLSAKTQGRTRAAAFNRVSFKPERAFNVIAHVRDWEHAEMVRRRCPRTV